MIIIICAYIYAFAEKYNKHLLYIITLIVKNYNSYSIKIFGGDFTGDFYAQKKKGREIDVENGGLKPQTKLIILGIGGFFGGLANGLLGAGGGIIMTFVLEKILSEQEMARRDIFANVIAATLPISMLSTIIYGFRGDINTERFGVFVLPAVIGGLIGAYLLARISTIWLKRIFAILVVWSGIYMILK